MSTQVCSRLFYVKTFDNEVIITRHAMINILDMLVENLKTQISTLQKERKAKMELETGLGKRCEVKDCNSTQTKRAFKGIFCNSHFKILNRIRRDIAVSKIEKNLFNEWRFRQDEMQIRGVDINHLRRIAFLKNEIRYRARRAIYGSPIREKISRKSNRRHSM